MHEQIGRGYSFGKAARTGNLQPIRMPLHIHRAEATVIAMEQGIEQRLAEGAARIVGHRHTNEPNLHLALLRARIEARLHRLGQFKQRQAEKLVDPHISIRRQYLKRRLVRRQVPLQLCQPTKQQQACHVRHQFAVCGFPQTTRRA